jgi:hypothetical protein
VTVPVATVPISLPVAATSAFALATTVPTDTVTELPVTAKFAAPLSVTSPIAAVTSELPSTVTTAPAVTVTEPVASCNRVARYGMLGNTLYGNVTYRYS